MTTSITNEDVDDLRTVLRDFLETLSDSARVREVMGTGTGIDDTLWRRMADELGLPGLAVPQAYGGEGYDFAVHLAVFEELGRSLACVPYLSTVGLAIPALLASGNATLQEGLLPSLAVGTTTATVAFVEADGDWSVPECRLIADRTSMTLTGRKSFVLDGCSADVVFVLAADDGLYVVDGTAPGLVRTPMRTLDATRRMATLEFDDTPARLLTGYGRSVLGYALDSANAALAAEQVGGAQRCMEMAVEYARLREQFGRPIGSFQAIKHKCADMLLGGRVGTIRGASPRGGDDRRSERNACRRHAGQGVLLGRLPASGRREHPDSRRNRFHVGARRPPVLPTRALQRATPWRQHLPAQAACRSAEVLGCRAYLTVNPASTGNVTPVMYRPPPPHRKTIASLMSAGSIRSTGSMFCTADKASG